MWASSSEVFSRASWASAASCAWDSSNGLRQVGQFGKAEHGQFRDGLSLFLLPLPGQSFLHSGLLPLVNFLSHPSRDFLSGIVFHPLVGECIAKQFKHLVILLRESYQIVILQPPAGGCIDQR
jgi:hypothetical protein